mgnify:CR=1 FL=1
MLFALSFLPMFGIGGLTGLPLGVAASDIYLHDTYYVIGHFHYVVAPGTIFAIFAGIYFWFPKITGKMMNETLGKIHFIFSLICMNGVFMPMFIQGLAGVSRRLADGGQSYAHAQHVLEWNEFMSWSAWGLGMAQIPFIVNFFMTIFKAKSLNADRNPWKATSIDVISSNKLDPKKATSSDSITFQLNASEPITKPVFNINDDLYEDFEYLFIYSLFALFWVITLISRSSADNIDDLLLLQPTSPLRRQKDVDNIFEIRSKFKSKSAVSITPSKKHNDLFFTLNKKIRIS